MSDRGELIKDKSPTWVHSVRKEDLLEFIGKFKFTISEEKVIYNFFTVDELKKICKRIDQLKVKKSAVKAEIIEVLIDFSFAEVLQLAEQDDLRRVVKEIIENTRFEHFQKLKEQAKEEKSKEAAGIPSESDAKEDRKVEKTETKESANSDTLESVEVIDSDETSDESEMGEKTRVYFTLHKDDWETFIAQLEMYFIAKDIKKDKQIAHLLTQVDTETFQLITELVSPAKLIDKTYDDIVKVMKEHVNPKPSELMERCNFHVARQEVSESVADYAARLKKLALKCEFKDYLSTALRDQLVLGLKNQDTKVELFKKENLTYEEAFKEAVAHESAQRNAAGSKNVMQNNESKREVFALRSTHQNWRNKNAAQSGRRPEKYERQQSAADDRKNYPQGITCYCCGKPNHIGKECRYKDYTCNTCHKKGHLSVVCRTKGHVKKDQQRVQLMQSEDDETMSNGKADDEAGSSYDDAEQWSANQREFFYLGEHSKNFVGKQVTSGEDREGNPMFVNVKINKMNVRMEIDTGTFATVISEDYYNKNLKSIKLVKTERKLKTYDNSILQPIGKLCKLTVHFRNKQCVLECFVLPGAGPLLMGRQWLAAFKAWPLKFDENFKNEVNKLKFENVAEQLKNKYKELFSDSPGLYNKSKTKIYLKKNTRPIALKCRHVAHALRPLIDQEIDRLVALGHLKPVDVSEWATPIVPVFKSNKKIRICGDFKLTVNPNIIMDIYPLHTIDDIFAKLQGGNTFTELDLRHAYMQFPVEENCQKFLTIITHKGLFSYTKVPEGVSPAPADVQRKMDECLRGIDGAIAYLDNIYVTGKTAEDHLQNLDRVCDRLQECGLRLNREKCKFMQKNLDVLGFVINKEGLHKAKSKIAAMVNAPKPENLKQLESFLGLINFYARFLENRSLNLKPLYDLLKKEKFEWDEKCSKAFNWVKNELISPKVLVNYDPKEKVILACDASNYGLSAILSHQYKDGTEKPIAYASKKIAKSELNRKILDKEAMAIIFGVERFYQFIFGREFILRTDNKALELILGPRKGIPLTADNRFQRWAYYLSGFRYKIQHVKSEANANCDALSRLPIDDNTKLIDSDFSHVNFFEEGIVVFDCKILAEESKKDELIFTTIKRVLGNWPNNMKEMSSDEKSLYNKRQELTTEKGCLFWGLRAVIPESMRDLMLRELHATHLGIVKIKMFARSYIWWPNIDRDIENYVKDCKICLINLKKPPFTPLTTWPWPDKAWSRIHCDFAGPFYGNMYLIVVDAHSKWPEIINFKSNTKAYRLIEEFRVLFSRFGLPLHCVTDGGPQFKSVEFQNFLKNNGVKHSFSPPYHPATNGAAENFVQTFKDKVDKIVKGGKSLEKAINMFLFDYRSIEHCTTKRSPAYLVYKKEIRTRFDLLRPNVSETVAEKQREQILARSGNRKVELSPGDQVMMDDFSVRTDKRSSGQIVKQTSPSTYIVSNDKGTYKRHIDQIVKCNNNNVKLRRSPRFQDLKGAESCDVCE